MRPGRTTATYWSPAIAFSPTPLEFDGEDQLRRVDCARATIGRRSRSRKPACSTIAAYDSAARTSQIVVRKLAIPPREKSSSTGAIPLALSKPVAIARVDRLDPGRDRAQLRLVDEGLHRVPLREAREDAGEQGGAEDAPGTAGTFLNVNTTSTRQRQQVERRDVEGGREGVAGHVGADLGVGSAVSPRTRKITQADPERRPGGPEHVADVLGDRDVADQLRDQDRRLRERRHLVAEVRAADHGAGGRRLGEARAPSPSPTKATPSVPAVVHELPVTMPTRAQIAAVATKKMLGLQQPDPVVDDGRDRAGHVPGADQRADREQDEDRSHRRRDAADRRVGDATRPCSRS